eukprot:1501795-Rhodomonas_salina.1
MIAVTLQAEAAAAAQIEAQGDRRKAHQSPDKPSLNAARQAHALETETGTQDDAVPGLRGSRSPSFKLEGEGHGALAESEKKGGSLLAWLQSSSEDEPEASAHDAMRLAEPLSGHGLSTADSSGRG